MMQRSAYALAGLVAALLVGVAACGVPAGDAGPGGPTHKQVGVVRVPGVEGRYALATFCLRDSGELLVCLRRAKQVRVLDPAGKQRATWNVPFLPQAICTGPEDSVYVGGGSQVAHLDKTGNVLKTLDLPVGKSRYQRVTALSVAGKDLFVAFRNAGGYTVYRYGQDFSGGKRIVGKLRGCCGQLDVAAVAGKVYVADNCRHRVACYDTGGKLLKTWGRRDRTSLNGFGGCCNPMNVCIGPKGIIYTAESAGRIKRFSPEGKLLGLVAAVPGQSGCKHVKVAVTRDGGRVFMIDVGRSAILVLGQGKAVAVASAAAGR